MSGIRKDKKTRWMPVRVYKGKSAYEWHPASGGCVRLCGLDSTPAEVWAAYEAAEQQRGKKPKYTVGDLAKAYFSSITFLSRKPRTQTDYIDSWGIAAKVFDGVDARKIEPKHIRAYMDKRGQKAPVRANREKSVLQNMFSHAYERGIVKTNPCKGVKSFPEPGREYYIDDDEYTWFYNESSELIQLFMELSYLNATRGQDVRKIGILDLKDIGIYIQQQKTGKKQIKEWTDRLRSVVDRAKARRATILEKLGIHSLYLLVNRTGGAYTASGLKTMWAKNRVLIEEKFNRKIEFTYHDIKAKGISDYEGDKQAFSGHKSRGQMEKYNRKPELVATLSVPYLRK